MIGSQVFSGPTGDINREHLRLSQIQAACGEAATPIRVNQPSIALFDGGGVRHGQALQVRLDARIAVHVLRELHRLAAR